MQDLLTYLTIIAAAVIVLYSIAASKTGWHPSEVFGRLKTNGDIGGIKGVVMVTVVIGILLLFTYHKASEAGYGDGILLVALNQDAAGQ